MEESAKQLPQLNMSQYKSLLKEEITRCPTHLSTNKKRINVRFLSGPWCIQEFRIVRNFEASGGIWRLVVSTNFSSNHSCYCALFSALVITHISSCCRQAAVRWGRTLVTLEFGADEVNLRWRKKDHEQLINSFVGLSGKETTCWTHSS